MSQLKISIKPVGLKEVAPFDLDVSSSATGTDLDNLISQKTGLTPNDFNLMVLGKTL